MLMPHAPRPHAQPRSDFMAVMFALSTADPATEAQRQLNISTQDLVNFFRVDGASKSVSDIMDMLVQLLETLTCMREGCAPPSY